MRAIAVFVFWCVSAAAGDLVLKGGTLYRSPEAPPIRDAVVLIHDDRIEAAGPRSAVSVRAGAQDIDIAGKFVVAGFWNSHVHVFTPVLLHAAENSAPAVQVELETMFNRWGFTTVFDTGSVLDNTLVLRRRIDGGELRGPRILTAGEPLWTEAPVYVRAFLKQMGIDMPAVTGPDDAAARVKALVRRGADGVKLFTGSLQSGGKVANMPAAIARAAVDEAHRAHLPVFAHPQNLAGVDVAIESGVDILAHTVPASPSWTPEFVARLVKARLALIPTLTLFDFEARKAGESEQGREQWIDKMVDELRAFRTGGGQVLFGTDIGYTDRYDTELEYMLMARAGMTFSEILASLTTNPAERFGCTRTGRIREGMDADLVVLASDPAKDVRAFSHVEMTIRRGKIVYSRN